jgi:hypothetical protein
MKLAAATPFSVCPCYEQMRQLGSVVKFYGCRNLASMVVQCAHCFDKCARCMEDESETSSSPRPDQSMTPTAVWQRRLDNFQDILFDSQARVIDAIGQPGLDLTLAILDRESTRFDTVLEALNTRELLLNERRALRRVLLGFREARKPPNTLSRFDVEKQAKAREKLTPVNEKLKEYGQLFGGRISAEHLEILSQRAQLLSTRRKVIALLAQHGSAGSILQAQLASDGARWKTLVPETGIAREKSPASPGVSVAGEVEVPRAERKHEIVEDWPLRATRVG